MTRNIYYPKGKDTILETRMAGFDFCCYRKSFFISITQNIVQKVLYYTENDCRHVLFEFCLLSLISLYSHKRSPFFLLSDPGGVAAAISGGWTFFSQGFSPAQTKEK